MLRALVILLFLTLTTAGFCRVDRQFATVHFTSDEYVLDAEARGILAQLLRGIDLNVDHELLLEGHTDAIGSSGYNEALAMERALAVRDALVEYGLDPERISIRALGERAPLAGNTLPEDRHRNRRVEITFQRYALESMADLHDALDAVRPETFQLDPQRDAWFTSAQGVTLYIPANAFLLPDGSCTKAPVLLTVTEALQLDAMITEGLSTMADSALLETGGMLKLDARTVAGQQLQLAENKAITLSIPTAAQQPGMELFLSNDGGNWTATGQAPRQLPSFTMPPRPLFTWPRWDRPSYRTDLSTRPKQPTDPVMPVEPNAPRIESYTSVTKWYHFLFRERIAEQDAQRYAAAMEAHDERMAEHAKKVESYEQACATYPRKLERHALRLEQWQQEELLEQLRFEREVVPASLATHKRKVKAAEQYYAKAQEQWDLCYAEEQERYLAVLDSMGMLDTRAVSGYVFMTNTLGWINCDRFYNVPEPMKHDVVVLDSDTTEKRVYLVFNDIKSMVNVPRSRVGEFRQPGIPRNEKATLLAYSVVDGQLKMQVSEVTGKGSVALDLKPAPVSALRQAIRDLQTGS